MGDRVVLVSTSDPGDAPEAVVGPVQYHADDSASGALTSVLGAPDEPADAGVLPRFAMATATPASTTTTIATTPQRRSRM
jgi:hypothetical protein